MAVAVVLGHRLKAGCKAVGGLSGADRYSNGETLSWEEENGDFSRAAPPLHPSQQLWGYGGPKDQTVAKDWLILEEIMLAGSRTRDASVQSVSPMTLFCPLLRSKVLLPTVAHITCSFRDLEILFCLAAQVCSALRKKRFFRKTQRGA